MRLAWAGPQGVSTVTGSREQISRSAGSHRTPDGGGVGEGQAGHGFPVRFPAKDAELYAGAVFLHLNGLEPTVQGPDLEEFFHGAAQFFAGGVVDVGFHKEDLVRFRGVLQLIDPEDVGMWEVLFSRADADPPDLHGGGGREGIPQSRQNGRAVGVIISPSTSQTVKGARAPVRRFRVAGTGTGIRPCWHQTVPRPSRILPKISRSTFKLSRQTAAAAMSMMESTAPTSWKWTSSTGTPWALLSAWARTVKIFRA